MNRLAVLLRRLQGDRRADYDGGRRRSDSEPNRGWRAVIALALAFSFSVPVAPHGVDTTGSVPATTAPPDPNEA